MIEQWCLTKGVKVHTSTRASAIEAGPKDASLHVHLDSGNSLDADLVVTATGVRPNVEFLAGSGVRVDQGVLIDRHVRTSVADVYAAGDVARGLDFSMGEYSVQAIQPTAADQGQLAARNMAGLTNARHRGCINMNVLDTLGLISSSFGKWMGEDQGECAQLVDRVRYRYLNLQFAGDTLVGATSPCLTQHVGVLRGLIQSRIRLGRWKAKLMRDPTRIMEAYVANTQALGFNAQGTP